MIGSRNLQGVDVLGFTCRKGSSCLDLDAQNVASESLALCVQRLFGTEKERAAQHTTARVSWMGIRMLVEKHNGKELQSSHDTITSHSDHHNSYQPKEIIDPTGGAKAPSLRAVHDFERKQIPPQYPTTRIACFVLAQMREREE